MTDRPIPPFILFPGERVIDGQPMYSTAHPNDDESRARAQQEVDRIIDEHYQRAAREIVQSTERIALRQQFEQAVRLLRRCTAYLPDNCSVEFDVLAFLGSLEEEEGE